MKFNQTPASSPKKSTRLFVIVDPSKHNKRPLYFDGCKNAECRGKSSQKNDRILMGLLLKIHGSTIAKIRVCPDTPQVIGMTRMTESREVILVPATVFGPFNGPIFDCIV